MRSTRIPEKSQKPRSADQRTYVLWAPPFSAECHPSVRKLTKFRSFSHLASREFIAIFLCQQYSVYFVKQKRRPIPSVLKVKSDDRKITKSVVTWHTYTQSSAYMRIYSMGLQIWEIPSMIVFTLFIVAPGVFITVPVAINPRDTIQVIVNSNPDDSFPLPWFVTCFILSVI